MSGVPMTGANLLFVVVGAIALIAGLVMLVTAIRGNAAERPRHALMLIAGMMTAAFGLVLGGFAIAATLTGPLDLNSAQGGQ